MNKFDGTFCTVFKNLMNCSYPATHLTNSNWITSTHKISTVYNNKIILQLLPKRIINYHQSEILQYL